MTNRERRAIELREAAAAWAKGLPLPVVGSKDTLFARLDAKLLRAALHYAEAMKDNSR